MDVASLIAQALSKPHDAVMYGLSQGLAQAFPDRYVLESEEKSFDVERYAYKGDCHLTPHAIAHSEFDTRHWVEKKTTYRLPYNSWQTVRWEAMDLELVTIGVQAFTCRNVRRFLVARDRETAERFFRTVCEWNLEVRGEVLVYHEGWHRDQDLYEEIKNATFDNLVLENGLKEQVRDDFARFFASRGTYELYGLPWKRGVLLLGPPGNGKTHMIKALVNHLGVPAFYVRTFEREYGTDQKSIREVFQRARTTAPCLLILEDLDSILNDNNRSFFLNEMDGFAANTGVMVVATTNHPERLDPAILERPSRFDRKVAFTLPTEDGRAAYLRQFREALEPALRLSDEEVLLTAALTEEFSYAYLKELYLSALMAWISEDGARPVVEVMRDQVDTLRDQMKTAAAAPPVPAAGLRGKRPWRKPPGM